MNPLPTNELISLIPLALRFSSCFQVAVTDLEGNYLYVNDFFKARYAHLAVDFEGLSVAYTLHPEDVPLCFLAVEQCLQNPEKPILVELRKPDSSQDYFSTQWELSVLKNKEGEAIGVLCLGYDTTEKEKASKDALLFSQKIDSILDNITDGVYILDRNWKFLKLNEVAMKSMGVSKEKLIGQDFWKILPHYEDIFLYPKMFRKAMEENKAVRFEDYRPDVNKWFSVSAFPSPEGLTIFFRDISEQKASGESLMLSQIKLKAILDSTTDGILLISPLKTILAFNKVAQRLSSSFLHRKMTEGENFQDYLLDETKKEFDLLFERTLNGQVSETEKELYFRDIKIWYRARFFPVHDHEGVLIGVSLNLSDISTQKYSETEIRSLGYKLKALYNSGNFGKIFIDKELKIAYFNKEAYQFASQNFKVEMKIGEPVLDYVLEESKAKFKYRLERALNGESQLFEREINYPPGQSIWLEIGFEPVYDEEGIIIGVSYNACDITNAKKAETRIKTQNSKLRKIAYIQSHKLRRPVSSILGLIDLINSESLDKENLECIHYLKRATEELDEAIREIVKKTEEEG